MNTKKNIAISSIFIAIFVAGVGVGYFSLKLSQNIGSTNKENISYTSNAKANQDLPKPTQEKELFLVKIKDKKVGVFKYDTSGSLVFQYYVDYININSLREQDKKSLEEGIIIHSKEELATMMEDFSS